MNLHYHRCWNGWKLMTEPDAQPAPDDATPDAFEQQADTDPPPQLHDDADDTYADLTEDPGVDDGDSDLDGDDDA